jgi:hypothetical protein
MLKKVYIPTKSVRNLADELKKMGHKTSHRMVAELLHDMDYSLQANRKTAEGGRIRTGMLSLSTFTGRSRSFSLVISVCHFPPGSSKWNKIEHRLFSCISRNWKGYFVTVT